MTEQDKVTVDDIIGIIKTEEQTNSVEEVRKLRGRENKTAKRFTIIYGVDENPFEWDLMDNEKDALICRCNGKPICDLLNELHEDLNHELTVSKALRDVVKEFEKENERLKSSDTITDLETEIMKLKTIIQQLRTDNTKQKKKLNTTMKENEHIKQTIKDMINTERTEIGKMTLRHLWRQIQ